MGDVRLRNYLQVFQHRATRDLEVESHADPVVDKTGAARIGTSGRLGPLSERRPARDQPSLTR